LCVKRNKMVKKLFNEIVIETEHFVVSQDWEAPIPGFFIISAKRKANSILDFSSEEKGEFCDLLFKVRKGMKDVLGIENVRLHQSEASKHNFHFWILPVCEWMSKFKEVPLLTILSYAKKNMNNDKNISKIKEYVKKMRDYMENS